MNEKQLPELTISVRMRVVSRLCEFSFSSAECKYFSRFFFIFSVLIKINTKKAELNNRMQPIGTITVVIE